MGLGCTSAALRATAASAAAALASAAASRAAFVSSSCFLLYSGALLRDSSSCGGAEAPSRPRAHRSQVPECHQSLQHVADTDAPLRRKVCRHSLSRQPVPKRPDMTITSWNFGECRPAQANREARLGPCWKRGREIRSFTFCITSSGPETSRQSLLGRFRYAAGTLANCTSPEAEDRVGRCR